jgi:hypothetical protein
VTFQPQPGETAWQVVTGYAVGNQADGYRCEYAGGLWYRTRDEAWTAGLAEQGSDDFNIGEIRDGRLLHLWWHDEVIEDDPADLAGIAEQIGCQP